MAAHVEMIIRGLSALPGCSRGPSQLAQEHCLRKPAGGRAAKALRHNEQWTCVHLHMQEACSCVAAGTAKRSGGPQCQTVKIVT